MGILNQVNDAEKSIFFTTLQMLNDYRRKRTCDVFHYLKLSHQRKVIN